MKAGQQTYLCRECNYRFMSERAMATDKIKKQAVSLYCVGLSFRTIGALLGFANTMVLIWVREFAKEHYQKPIPKGEIVLELDEMWHFLNLKKTNCGFGKHIVAQLDNLLTGNLEIAIPGPLSGCIVG
jgi:hypothetical protein